MSTYLFNRRESSNQCYFRERN